MKFIADLHIHSRFSMATSSKITVNSLAGHAMCKGIDVLGTGDFTHPQWQKELAESLCLDEHSGLYRLRGEPLLPFEARCSRPPLFCLQTELCCIYKAGGKTRRLHHLVYVPHMEVAQKLSRSLEAYGRLGSDGRPVLKLSSRDLLEMVLESSPGSVLIPAHIWTPWFALFGSKSGYDSLEDCFGDLSGHIFALETGLSSDPPMNRYLSALDGHTLISNSDAHSGANLGREANIFNGQPSYAGIFSSLRDRTSREEGCSFEGTLEFYPQEGKYYLDGHRNCNVCLEPAESAELGERCPKCGRPLTLGVLNRIMQLADRSQPAMLPDSPSMTMVVPLPEVIAQVCQVKPSSRKVAARYGDVVSRLGPDLEVLHSMPVEEIKAYWPELGEAVARLRHGEVVLTPGFDGQYGKVEVRRHI